MLIERAPGKGTRSMGSSLIVCCDFTDISLEKNMRLKLLSFVILLLGFVCTQAQPPESAKQTTEKVRVQRLVGLANVWGQVKYFHPFLAYREIDWDKALIEAIPRVSAAKTPAEYEAAINAMLAFLDDKSTRARIVEKKLPGENQPKSSENNDSIRLEGGVLMIDAFAVASVFHQAANRRAELSTKTKQLIPQAKAVLIDLRPVGAADGDNEYYLNSYLQAVLPAMLDKNVPLASLRYRVHSGYAPQVGSTSGGYYSAVMNTAPETLAGNNKAKTPPLIFLVNEESPLAEMLGGLQAAQVAYVIQDGNTTGAGGAITTTIKLSESVVVEMRTAELVNPDGSVGLAADLVAPRGEAMPAAQRVIAEGKFVSHRARTLSAFTPQVSQKEKTYAEMEFPAVEYRLLALFRFWNIINYFYPYKDLIGSDWNDMLPRYIPKFEENKDAVDYQMTVRELLAEVHDSHVGVRNANASDAKIGMFFAPVLLRFVENQTVVVKVLDEKLPVHRGDVVLAIDGEPVEKRREFFARLISASTPQALMSRVQLNLLRGQKDSLAKLTIRGVDGETREVEIARSASRQDPKIFDALLRSGPVVQILPDGFAYVDLERLTVAEVDKMFETIKGAPAVIFDMRGYPNGTAWAIAPRLTTKKSPVGALFSRPFLEGISFSSGELSIANYSFAQKIPEADGDVYTGKIVMLISEDAISQAEHTALFFEAARPDITFIGTPTAGANGDVTVAVLPGNLSVSFSGHSVRHADGRQLQRVGVQPTIKVEPTIRGIIEGRDEPLEAAIKFLQPAKTKQ
jgi:C-terminal processing protease CtpA/Prc